MIQLNRILVPIDFSDNSTVALEYATALADLTGGRLFLLHVLQSPMGAGWAAEVYVQPPAEFFEQIERDSRDQLSRILTDAQKKQYHAEIACVTGSPFLEILQYAKQQAIDLIVMGTHGRGAVSHILMGSVAERVVRKAPCAVLTIRHPEHEFVMP